MEDLNDGWRKNGSISQEIYGAGACFTFAANAYEKVPEVGGTVYSEYPLLGKSWDPKEQVLTLRVGGVSRYNSKLEVSGTPKIMAASVALANRPTERSLISVSQIQTGCQRFAVRGDSLVRLRLDPAKSSEPSSYTSLHP